MHRMGPSFKRHRWGSLLFFLGATLFVSINRPSDLGVSEREIFASFQSNITWVITAILSIALLLSGSSNYRTPNYPILTLGLISGFFSCYLALMEIMESSIVEIFQASLTLIGIFIGTSAFILGSFLAEKSTRVVNESRPLSEEERELVSKILRNRLEGATNDN